MVGGGGRLDFLRFNLVVPVSVLVLGFCEDDIFLSLSVSLSVWHRTHTQKKNTDRQSQSRSALFSLSLSLSVCVCVCLCGSFQPARARFNL